MAFTWHPPVQHLPGPAVALRKPDWHGRCSCWATAGWPLRSAGMLRHGCVHHTVTCPHHSPYADAKHNCQTDWIISTCIRCASIQLNPYLSARSESYSPSAHQGVSSRLPCHIIAICHALTFGNMRCLPEQEIIEQKGTLFALATAFPTMLSLPKWI